MGNKKKRSGCGKCGASVRCNAAENEKYLCDKDPLYATRSSEPSTCIDTVPDALKPPVGGSLLKNILDDSAMFMQTDPLGSYTGIPKDGGEPTQDVDDL